MKKSRELPRFQSLCCCCVFFSFWCCCCCCSFIRQKSTLCLDQRCSRTQVTGLVRPKRSYYGSSSRKKVHEVSPSFTTLLPHRMTYSDRCTHDILYWCSLQHQLDPLSLSLLISLSLGETLLLEPFDGKVYDLLPVFLPELWSCPSNHLCLAPIFWLVFLSLSFRLS